MKAKAGPIELEVTKDDYNAIQKVSNLAIFKLVSDELGYFRQVNLMRISKKFEKKCKKYNLSPNQVAPRFLTRFIEASSYEDNELIQDIWADILLREATTPNSNSLRTIDVLKNISREEALMFQRLCKDALFVGAESVIFNNQGYDRNLDDIFRLVDCGLLISDNVNVVSSTKIPSGGQLLVYKSARKTLVIRADNKTQEEQTCSISILSMTEAGRNIFESSVVEKIDDTKFADNARIIKDNNKNLEISLHKIEATDGQTITYSQKDLLAEEKKPDE